MNVFLIAVSLMAFLRKEPAECRNLGIAALLHDVGLLHVPPAVLYKPGPLSPQERTLVREHPRLGHDLLAQCPAVPLESLRLIVEHHENNDGSGYPYGLEMWQQHPYTQILRLVDAYEALTSQRPHRPPYSPFRAIQILRDQKGKAGPIFDQKLLKSLVTFMAL